MHWVVPLAVQLGLAQSLSRRQKLGQAGLQSPVFVAVAPMHVWLLGQSRVSLQPSLHVLVAVSQIKPRLQSESCLQGGGGVTHLLVARSHLVRVLHAALLQSASALQELGQGGVVQRRLTHAVREPQPDALQSLLLEQELGQMVAGSVQRWLMQESFLPQGVMLHWLLLLQRVGQVVGGSLQRPKPAIELQYVLVPQAVILQSLLLRQIEGHCLGGSVHVRVLMLQYVLVPQTLILQSSEVLQRRHVVGCASQRCVPLLQ
jgi:hypothetical protein